MRTEDRFHPDRPPIFLSDYPDEIEQPDTGGGWDLATVASRILKTSILAVTVTAIGIAVLSVGNPVVLLANVTDWLDSKPALQADADPTSAAVQTMAGAQDNLTATDAAARSETVAAVQPAEPGQVEATDQRQAETSQRQAEAAPSQAETSQPVSEELFKQFQAWAAEEDARKQPGSAQPVQAAPVRVAQDAPERARPAKRHRRVHSVQNARAELRPQRHHRVRVQEEQDPRSLAPPAADPRAPVQDPAAQNAQQPGFFQSLGFRGN
jgi:hypothetical protein